MIRPGGRGGRDSAEARQEARTTKSEKEIRSLAAAAAAAALVFAGRMDAGICSRSPATCVTRVPPRRCRRRRAGKRADRRQETGNN